MFLLFGGLMLFIRRYLLPGLLISIIAPSLSGDTKNSEYRLLSSKKQKARIFSSGPVREIASDGRKIKLNRVHIQSAGFATYTLESDSGWIFEVPRTGLVKYRNEVGVYRREGAWFELVPVSIVHSGQKVAIVRSRSLRTGDKLVVKGVDKILSLHVRAYSSRYHNETFSVVKTN
jgi:hypothetical protein